MVLIKRKCMYFAIVLICIIVFPRRGTTVDSSKKEQTGTTKQAVKKQDSVNQKQSEKLTNDEKDGGSVTVLSRMQFEQLEMAGKHMIVEFGSPNCQKCKEFQKEYEKLSHILIGEGIGVYRVDDPVLSRKYGIPRLPTLIYFRDEGLPVMYFGGLEGYEIAEWLDSNAEQISVNLSDDTFEHLTQASTGATTGNWMVNFCKSDVPGCAQLSPSWEGAAARLKGRANFAYVDPTKNELLKKRFNIGDSLPVIMLFRQGKQYVYELPARDPASLAVFAETGYQHAKAEPVSIQASPFDTLVEKLARNLKEFTSDKDLVTLYMCFGALFVIAVMGIALFVECCYIVFGENKAPKDKKSK